MPETYEVDAFLQPKQNVGTDLNKKALLRQLFMSLMSIGGPFIAGACYSQPTITINQLTDREELVFLTRNQASWYGESVDSDSVKLKTKSNIWNFPSSGFPHDIGSHRRPNCRPADG